MGDREGEEVDGQACRASGDDGGDDPDDHDDQGDDGCGDYDDTWCPQDRLSQAQSASNKREEGLQVRLFLGLGLFMSIEIFEQHWDILGFEI